MPQPYINFYRGLKPDIANHSHGEIYAADNKWLETTHDWVQWAFPGTEKSFFQPHLPLLSYAEIEVFRNDADIRRRVTEMVFRYTVFLTSTEHWRTPNNHNHLRITRMLKFLWLINMRPAARQAHRHILSLQPNATAQTLRLWADVVRLTYSMQPSDSGPLPTGREMDAAADRYFAHLTREPK